MRPLGKKQLGCLRSLCKFGAWPGQWIWGTRLRTRRILNSLVKRRLAKIVTNDATGVYRYHPTDAGRLVAKMEDKS